MRKRKELAYEGYDNVPPEPLPPMVRRGQRLGLVLLFLVSSLGLGNWIVSGIRSHVDGLYASFEPDSVARAPLPAPTRPAVVQVNALAGDRLVIGGADGGLLANDGAGTFNALRWRGEDVAVAASALAYRRDDELWVVRQNHEWSLNRPGILPSWSADGERLAFAERTAAGDVVYVLLDARKLDSQPTALLTVSEIAAPPRFHPATGRLLIAERISAAQTTFFTVDPGRCILSAPLCAESRRDVGLVNLAVNWADYHPGATAIVFSERELGRLYQLNTGDGTVAALPTVGFYARRPAFSPDGTRVAFLSDSGGVFVMDMRNGAVRGLPDARASSVDWAK